VAQVITDYSIAGPAGAIFSSRGIERHSIRIREGIPDAEIGVAGLGLFFAFIID